MKFSIEPWPNEEMDEIFRQEFREVNEFQSVCTGILDHKHYRWLDQNGRLISVIARSEGKIIGYLIWLIYPHLQNKDLIVAAKNMIYVVPEWRRQGVADKMMDIAMKECVDRGARLAFASDKYRTYSTQRLMRIHGFRRWQVTYAKAL